MKLFLQGEWVGIENFIELKLKLQFDNFLYFRYAFFTVRVLCENSFPQKRDTRCFSGGK